MMKQTQLHFTDAEWHRLAAVARTLDVTVGQILHMLADRYVATLEWETARLGRPGAPRLSLVGQADPTPPTTENLAGECRESL